MYTMNGILGTQALSFSCIVVTLSIQNTIDSVGLEWFSAHPVMGVEGQSVVRNMHSSMQMFKGLAFPFLHFAM